MQRFISFVGLFLSVCLIGCGDQLSQVEGTVTLDDEPLEGALVRFTPKQGGRPSVGKTDKKGRYKLMFSLDNPGVTPGVHVVRISTEANSGDPKTGRPIYIPERVPPKYNVQSELVEEVVSGEQEINFNLKTE